MTETPLELLAELREVLAPMLAGLSDENPSESLDFAFYQLTHYMLRCDARRSEMGESDDSDADTT